MPLARFVAFHPVAEARVAERPLKFALMIAIAPQGVVLVLNTWRKVWELPGGLIDPGETPRQAAVRELAEEAGADVRDVEWLGVSEVDDGDTHFGAVFRATVVGLRTVASEEVGGVDFWTPDRHPEPLGHTDAALLERFAR